MFVKMKIIEVRIWLVAFFVLTLQLSFFWMGATAQVKSKSMFLPPEMIKSPAEKRKILLNASPILKLIDQAGKESPLAFVWQLNTDTTVKKSDLFREVIEFEEGATVRKAMAIDTTILQQHSEADYDVRRNFSRFSMALESYQISQQKGKPVLVFTSNKSEDKLYFKVFLDKAGKKILKIQNLSNRRFYLPVPFEGGTISM